MDVEEPEFELIIPAYNESMSLYLLISGVITSAKNSGFCPKRFQLVIVENGSTDESFFILENLLKTEFGKWFRIVTLKSNRGYGYGIWQGLSATTAKYIGWSHADLQCNPEDAFRALFILKELNSISNLVKGARNGRNWKDRLVSRIFEFMAYLILGLKINEINAQPKIFSRELLSFIKTPPSGFSFDLYIIYQAIKKKYIIHEIPVLFPARIFGTSHWAASFIGRYKTIWLTIKYMLSLAYIEGRLKKNKTEKILRLE